jgi:hypothetical protein
LFLGRVWAFVFLRVPQLILTPEELLKSLVGFCGAFKILLDFALLKARVYISHLRNIDCRPGVVTETCNLSTQ